MTHKETADNSFIEIINPDVKAKTGKIKFAVFDFDGTISLLRRGWDTILAPVMVESICGDHPPTQEIKDHVDEYIDESTGIQTILQMEVLIDMIRQYGYVPEEKILDPYEYKQIYNKRLMVKVTKRIDEAEKGIIPFEEYVVPGSIELLSVLFHKGVTMYITSGTDRPDVIREAKILEFDKFFGERIYGALRTFKEYSKEKVINEIVHMYDLKGPELVVIGDGKVEMRNGKAVGAVTVGVATEEHKRDGVNPKKRDRLIKAGADIIIPDYKDCKEVISFLFD